MCRTFIEHLPSIFTHFSTFKSQFSIFSVDIFDGRVPLQILTFRFFYYALNMKFRSESIIVQFCLLHFKRKGSPESLRWVIFTSHSILTLFIHWYMIWISFEIFACILPYIWNPIRIWKAWKSFWCRRNEDYFGSENMNLNIFDTVSRAFEFSFFFV